MVRTAQAAAEELREALMRLGAKRVESTLVASLVEAGAVGTRDLVERTGLRQPEVSVGMRTLRERNWVMAEPVPRQGRGRPMHRYRLQADPATIRRYYEDLGKTTIHDVETAMQVVRRKLGTNVKATSSSRQPAGVPA